QDIESNQDAQRSLELNKIALKDLPTLFLEDGSFFCSPEIPLVAEKIGLNPTIRNTIYDVVIIGAGPAGLAASVYGASEGLKTLLVERRSPGGQAGTSSRIENYLGFPNGLSGSDLTRRAISQATRLGAEVLLPRSVKAIEVQGNYKKIILEDDKVIMAKAIVITTGVDYRQLTTPGIAQFK